MFVKSALNKMVAMIKKKACMLVSAIVSGLAFAADKVIAAALAQVSGGLASGLLITQAQPQCLMTTGKTSKFVKLLKKLKFTKKALKAASKAICKIPSNEYIKLALKGLVKWEADCAITGSLVTFLSFGVNIMCGQFALAVNHVLSPVIMCHLPLGPSGAKCRSTCIR